MLKSLSLCCSLVSVKKDNERIYLVHFRNVEEEFCPRNQIKTSSGDMGVPWNKGLLLRCTYVGQSIYGVVAWDEQVHHRQTNFWHIFYKEPQLIENRWISGESISSPGRKRP